MACQQCGNEVGADQKFCTQCGVALPAASADARTELLPVLDDEPWGDDDPVWAITGAIPTASAAGATEATEVTPSTVATSDLPVTEAFQPPVPGTAAAVSTGQAATATDPSAPGGPYDFVVDEPRPGVTAPIPVVTPTRVVARFRFGLTMLLAIVGGIVTLVAVFATLLVVSSDVELERVDDAPAGFRTGSWIADSLGDNLSIAGLIAAMSLVVGGVAAGFGWRWGSGLAGGGGLATAGLAALVLGLVQRPIDAAREFADVPSEQAFTLTITRDLGYWLLLAAAAIGIVVFFASINDAAGDRRPGLNPWIAALGALAALVTAVGPLIPEDRGSFADNWTVVDAPGAAPALLLLGRLVQLALLAFAGVVGFLSVRRYGLGIAIGAALPIVWLAISTVVGATDTPVGPAERNPGALEPSVHGVTIIGVAALVGVAVLAVIAAYDQGVRERA